MIATYVGHAGRLFVVVCFFATSILVAQSRVETAAEAAHPRPGDRIVVQIFGEERLPADTVTISSRGFATLPRLGPVDVSSFTLGTVADTLRERYSRFYRTPTVDVLVLRRIAVNGEVKKPDVYYVDLSAMLPDAIALAGGVGENGNARKVSIVRGNETIPVPEWDRAGASNTDLRSGDLILVGRRSWWSQNLLSAMSASAALISLVIALRR